MTDAETIRADRDSPLPEPMQGNWIFEQDGHSELVIEGGEISCLGQVVDYDYKEIVEEDGTLTVNLRLDDGKDEDSFQRTNLTGLVITAEGDFIGWNARWGARFARPGGEMPPHRSPAKAGTPNESAAGSALGQRLSSTSSGNN